MKEHQNEEEKQSYNYFLEVGEDGELYHITEYGYDVNGDVVYSEWIVNSTIDVDGTIYF